MNKVLWVSGAYAYQNVLLIESFESLWSIAETCTDDTEKVQLNILKLLFLPSTYTFTNAPFSPSHLFIVLVSDFLLTFCLPLFFSVRYLHTQYAGITPFFF